MESYNA